MKQDLETDLQNNAARPKLVYFDQADWSYLADGKAGESEATLRRAAISGQCKFLISVEHLYEIAGLQSGRVHRLNYIRDFPNTHLIRNSTQDILLQAVETALSAVRNPSAPQTWKISLNPMKDFSLCDLEAMTATARFSRPFRKLSYLAKKLSRLATKKHTKDTLRKKNKAIAAMLRGDKVAFRKSLNNEGGRMQKILGVIFLEFGILFGRVGTYAGIWPPLERTFDDTFQSCIMPYVILAERNTEHYKRQLYQLYKNKTAFTNASTPLACKCAVYESTYFNTSYEYQISDEIDKDHAVYAVFSDVFTCDKRNVEVLKSVFKTCSKVTSVIRTGKVSEVVRTIENKVKNSTESG